MGLCGKIQNYVAVQYNHIPCDFFFIKNNLLCNGIKWCPELSYMHTISMYIAVSAFVGLLITSALPIGNFLTGSETNDPKVETFWGEIYHLSLPLCQTDLGALKVKIM